MQKAMKIIQYIEIIIITLITSLLLYRFVYKIHHEKVDTTYMWNINVKNIKVTEGSKNGEIIEKDNKLELKATLNQPKEFYEVTFDIVNEGTLSAYINKIYNQVDSTDNILKYYITYLDGREINKGDVLPPEKKKTIKIRIEYPEINSKIYKELQLNLQFKIFYKAVY